ncbi:MAG: hypothetical protein WA958_06970 [Tunicatimonas sp.]
MKDLILRTILFLTVGLGLSNCNYQPQATAVPLAVAQYFATLSAMDQPVKVVVDATTRQIYWLSFTGEIYQACPDGSGSERIMGGVGVQDSVLFIQDFCVDAANHRIIFTDLRDPRTGNGAIKQASLTGDQVSTLITLPNETPYQVGTDARTGQLYYLTESEKPHSVYRLRTLDQEGALLVSATKIHTLRTGLDTEETLATTATPLITKALAKR